MTVSACARCRYDDNDPNTIDLSSNYFLSANGRNCLEVCPLKQFEDPSDPNLLKCSNCLQFCDKCTEAAKCLVCSPGYMLSLSKASCEQTCPIGSYRNGSVCLGCGSNCAECLTGTTCERCNQGWHINRDTSTCLICELSQSFFVSENLYCDKCHLSCLTCNGPEHSQCLTCRPGYTYQTLKKVCLDDAIPKIKVVSVAFNPRVSEIKITFDRKVSAVNIGQVYAYELFNGDGSPSGFSEKRALKFTDGSTAATIRINFQQDIKNGKFVLKPKPPAANSQNVNIVFDSNEPNLTFEETIEVSIPETQSVSMSKAMDSIGAVSGPVMKSATSFTMFLSFTSAVALLKIFQMMDYMVLFSVIHPENFQKFVEILTSNIFDYIPNVFKVLTDDDCDPMKPKFAENEMSCQFISNSGNLFFLMLIIIFLKLVVILVKVTSRSPSGQMQSSLHLKFAKLDGAMGYSFFISFMDMF